MDCYKYQVAELLLRLMAGFLFFFQGYDKLFRIKIPGVVQTFSQDAQRMRVPGFLLGAMASVTSIIEFVGGAMLILGIFSNYALYFLGFDLVVVSLAFSLTQPMWDMKHVFPRFALVITLLLLPQPCAPLSLGYLLNMQ